MQTSLLLHFKWRYKGISVLYVKRVQWIVSSIDNLYRVAVKHAHILFRIFPQESSDSVLRRTKPSSRLSAEVTNS
jgi:hypothetical protein